MKKVLLVLAILATIVMVQKSFAADVTLEVTIPDAWVVIASEAIDNRFEGRTESGMTIKQWAEYQIKEWLKDIIVPYKNNKSQLDAADNCGHVDITRDDIPL